MDEVENKEVVSEVAAPEASPQETIQEAPVETKQDRDWRELRRIKNELEQKAKMQEELIGRLLSQQPQALPQTPAIDELDSIPDDDYLPKGKVKKLLEKEREEGRRVVREEIQKIHEENEKANFHVKLKSKFSDFDEVLTPETLELLETQEPELAKEIAANKDPYKMAFQAYKYIKALGLVDKAPNFKRSKEVEKKLEQNSKTVQSPQAFDKRPMAQTFQMTEQMKQDLYKEMTGAAQRAGSVPQLN